MVDDSTLELDEYFTVELSSDKEEPVLLVDGSSISTVFILNDDSKECCVYVTGGYIYMCVWL